MGAAAVATLENAIKPMASPSVQARKVAKRRKGSGL